MAAVKNDAMTPKSVPLCVDLDGTLIRSDLLMESALALVSKHPLSVFSMLLWLLRGKAHLKKQIAMRVTVDADSLPYNEELLSWLRDERAHRTLILCTASDELLTTPVAQHVDIFDDLLASDGHINLSGRRKAKALIERFGEKGFDYVGNAPVDISVWKHARHAYVIEHGTVVSSAASKVAHVERRFIVSRGGIKAWAKAIRIHQWIKNLLVFLPLIAAHRIFDVGALTNAVLSFVAFGLCASSVYLTNDLLDLSADRRHHRKRNRPFAAGTLPIVAGPALALALLLAGFILARAVSVQLTFILLCYYVLTTAYSFKLKRVMMLDVVVLAMLYTSRILAGASATQMNPSFWLLAFSMFIFLSLAMVKRYTELLNLQSRGQVSASGRGYDVEDIPLIQSLGSSSGYLAVLVLALYIESTASNALYRHPHYLWMLCPLLLYWISRTWAIAHRGVMHDDPVVFAVMDNTSRAIGAIAAIIIALSI